MPNDTNLTPEAAFANVGEETKAAEAIARVVAPVPETVRIEFQGCGQTFVNDGQPVEVIRDFSLVVEGHQTVALLGPSGCGKSTLLGMVSGLYPRGNKLPTVGRVLNCGEVVDGPQDNVLTVFQRPVLCRWLTILGNVELSFLPSLWAPRPRWPWEIAQDYAAHMANFIPPLRGKVPHSTPRKEIIDRSKAMLEAVGLGDCMHQFPHQLSGGMRQRASLATVLAVNPQVICADEPTGALDADLRVEMRTLVKRLGVTYPSLRLWVTHDVHEALTLADRVVVLSTKPATKLADIEMPKDRPEDWSKTPEYVALQARILQMLHEAHGHGSVRVSV